MSSILTSSEFEKLYKIVKNTLVKSCRVESYEILPLDLLVEQMIITIRDRENESSR